MTCFLSLRDLKVSKDSQEPTERKELGYVKYLFIILLIRTRVGSILA